jgi:hypothetical protein
MEVPEMPYIIRPRSARRIIAALLGSTALIAAVPAVASAACPATVSTQAFAAYGDSAYYALVQNGTFDSGATGWSLSNAEVFSEYSQSSGGIAHAVKIRSHGRATSPGFCVSSEYPTFRFLVRRVWGQGRLGVSLHWTDRSGSHEASVASLQAEQTWAVSPVLGLASNLPTSGEATVNPVQLVFENPQYDAGFAISYVYIDPYRR